MSDARGTAADAASLDTFPRLLMQHARQRPNRPAMREKEYGIWQTYTWAEVAERVLTLDELTKRGFGEALYPGMDEAQRAARLLADDMNDMENRIARREEWMAAETMIGNGCVMQEYIDGATKGDSLVVKFYDGTSDHTSLLSLR